MRVLLVGSEVEENLATRYLASSLEAAGHDASLVSFSRLDQLGGVVGHVRATEPDVVGFSMAFQRRAREFGAHHRGGRARQSQPRGSGR